MGKLAEIKTKPTTDSVESFINNIPDELKQKDNVIILKIMEKATNEKRRVWGSSMIGLGSVRYKSPATRYGDWFKMSFKNFLKKDATCTALFFNHYNKLYVR